MGKTEGVRDKDLNQKADGQLGLARSIEDDHEILGDAVLGYEQRQNCVDAFD